MGTNSSYFFQPGVPSRQNPLTPQSNFKMTAQIAEYHAKALDKIGSLYYSKENFDDFYYGKGSTYPDVHGSIGILFEQASARGHRQNSVYGEITFPFAIKNQLTTSISTIKATQAKKEQLKSMRSDFVKETAKMAKSDKSRAVVFESNDAKKMQDLSSLLAQHQIEVYELSKNLKIESKTYQKKHAAIIPLQQPQYRLIKSLFEYRKTFNDRVFYDVSSWNMGEAFDVNFDWVSRSKFDRDLLVPLKAEKAEALKISKEALAIAFDWRNMKTAGLLVKLMSKGLRVQGVTKPARFKTSDGEISLSSGSLILALANQPLSREAIVSWLESETLASELNSYQITSGISLIRCGYGEPQYSSFKESKASVINWRWGVEL